MGIYITSNSSASGTIQVGTISIPFTVTANTVVRKFLGPGNAGDAPNTSVYLSQSEGISTGAAIHVTSDNPVVVYAHIIKSARSGATLLLPSNVWGREYIVPSYSSIGNTAGGGNAAITIVAADTNTTVQITPKVASLNNAHPANTPYTITLANPGDVYQVQFAHNADISGTDVQSVSTGSGCKKIAVFSSTNWSAFGCSSASSGDNLYQQLFPTGAWGKSFLTAPAKTRTSDIIRVFVTDPTTVVTKTENGITTTLSGLVNGSFYEYSTGNPTYIQASKPASVIQYFTTQACQNGATIGDPEMIVINPVEQTINNITVFSAHKNWVPANQSAVTNCYLNIIIKTAATASFHINAAAPASSFIPIPGTAYSYLQEEVTNSAVTNPVESLTADSNFIAIAYGFGNVESYGYNAGTNVIDLTQGIVIQSQYATTTSQSTCRNTPVSFAIKFPYQPTSLSWDFSNSPAISPNTPVSVNSPVPDSSFVDNNSGKTIYLYKLPGNYTFNATGSFPVKVTANNPTSDGCSGLQVVSYSVQVFDPPVTNFSFATSGCATDSVRFTDASNANGRTLTQWIWDFGDTTGSAIQNPAKLYRGGGTYNVHLRTVTDIGCVSDTTKKVVISGKPVAKFGVSAVTCVNTSLNFTDSSSVSAGTVNAWYWNYGNGKTDTLSTGTTRAQTYSTVGTDTVSLQVQTTTGCNSAVFAVPANIHPFPKVGFILPEVCLNDASAQFSDTSSIADGSQAQFSYAWRFNAGTPAVSPPPTPLTSTLKNPSARYFKADNYSVALTVTSKDGCVDSLLQPFTVNGSQPNAGFFILDSSSLCSNTAVRLEDTSTVDFGKVTALEIYWDNNGSAVADTIKDPVFGTVYSHSYPSLPITKRYTIRFVAHSGNASSCSATKLYTVTVNQSPHIQFLVIPGICMEAAGRQITQATETGNVPGSFLFSGVGVTGAGLYQPQTVQPGSYAIKYLYVTPTGCRDSATQNITVWPSPVARWKLGSPDCEKNPITFFDSSVANVGNIVSRFWDFGDGNQINRPDGNPFTKQYAVANSYEVSLRVVTDSGCQSATNLQQVVVHYLPRVSFSLPAICLPDGRGQFNDLSSIPDNSQNLFSYYWNFGDGADPTPSTLKSPVHRYSALGPYTVVLRVTSKDGCVDSLSSQLTTVYPQPQAAFVLAPPEVCVGDSVRFTDNSNGLTSNIQTWAWSLAGGDSSHLQNPAKRFTDSGNLIITLFITNAQNCVSDTAMQTVVVHPYPRLTMGPGLVVLQGGTVAVKPLYVYGSSLVYLWSPSTYLSSDTAQVPLSKPAVDMEYHLQLTGLGGCSVSDSIMVTVLKSPIVPNAFSPNGDGINDTWKIQYLQSYPGATIDVFNRYGQNVFHTVNNTRDWDGTFNGQPLPVGTYYYIIDPKNGRPIQSGSVTIIR